MKILHPALLIALAALLQPVRSDAQTTYPPKDRAAIVFVGHSLTNFDMPLIAQRMAESKGLTMRRVVQVGIGTPLKGNWEHCRGSGTGPNDSEGFACTSIEAGSPIGPWDTLIATDANNSIESNRIWNETHRYLDNFMALMLSREPSSRIFMFTAWESWGYHSTGTWMDAIPGELAQYQTIVTQANALSTQAGRAAAAQVLPANLALRDLLNEIQQGRVPGVTAREQIFGDAVHMTKLGNYFMAAVVFSAVYNRSPEGATGRILDQYGALFLDVPAATAAALHTIAWNTVSTYRGGPAPARPRPPTSLQVN